MNFSDLPEFVGGQASLLSKMTPHMFVRISVQWGVGIAKESILKYNHLAHVLESTQKSY